MTRADCQTTEQRMNRLLAALSAYKPDRIYLFGSWARGEQDEVSDIDLVIIKETSAHFFQRLKEVGRLLPHDLGGIDVLVYTPSEFETMQRNGNAFASMIVEEGRLIYGKHSES